MLLPAARVVRRVATTVALPRWTARSVTTKARVPLRPFVASEHAAPSWSLQDYATERAANASHAPAPITPAELAHLAQLSHLALPSEPDAAARTLADVESVVAWVGSISALNMDAYEPMYTPLEVSEYYSAINTQASAAVPATSTSSSSNAEVATLSSGGVEALRLRADEVSDGGIEKQVLANAAYKHRGFFVVPKVRDNEDS